MTPRVKIVDDFNGYESPPFSDRGEAENELAQRRRDFYAHPGYANAIFHQVIVPAHYTWYFDERRNRFVWGETPHTSEIHLSPQKGGPPCPPTPRTTRHRPTL